MPQVNFTDASGHITIGINTSTAPAAQHHTDWATSLEDPEMIVIGGGAIGSGEPGGLLTASYPNSDLTSWLVSSKDHLVVDAHPLTAFAIGLKFDTMPRDSLFPSVRVFTESNSLCAPHPTASVFMPSTAWKVIGGGFKVHWCGAGNVATASYPEAATPLRGPGWTAASKDHVQSSPGAITAYAIAVYDPEGSLAVTIQDQPVSATAAHPATTVALPAGSVLTGVGARVNYGGAGSLLWALAPSFDSAASLGAVAKAKDHVQSDPATVQAFAVGIRALV